MPKETSPRRDQFGEFFYLSNQRTNTVQFRLLSSLDHVLLFYETQRDIKEYFQCLQFPSKENKSLPFVTLASFKLTGIIRRAFERFTNSFLWLATILPTSLTFVSCIGDCAI